MATPRPPSSDDDGTPAGERTGTDRAITTVMLAVALFITGALSVAATLGVGYCTDTCSAAIFVGNILARGGLFFVFLVSLVVSIATIRRGKRAFYVPLVGVATMIAIFAAWEAAR